jgi:hypothetical protein
MASLWRETPTPGLKRSTPASPVTPMICTATTNGWLASLIAACEISSVAAPTPCLGWRGRLIGFIWREPSAPPTAPHRTPGSCKCDCCWRATCCAPARRPRAWRRNAVSPIKVISASSGVQNRARRCAGSRRHRAAWAKEGRRSRDERLLVASVRRLSRAKLIKIEHRIPNAPNGYAQWMRPMDTPNGYAQWIRQVAMYHARGPGYHVALR